jgi:hypothetical protein
MHVPVCCGADERTASLRSLAVFLAALVLVCLAACHVMARNMAEMELLHRQGRLPVSNPSSTARP